MKKTIRVPATTANLGPGFDSLGLALRLWNEAEFSLRQDDGPISISVEGFGAGLLPAGPENFVARSAEALFSDAGVPAPPLHIRCRNGFPGGSGLGSSSSAILLGLAGANVYLDAPFGADRLLDLANRIEGHPDNVTPALLGGLTLSAVHEGRVLARRLEPDPGWIAGVVVPDLTVSTAAMRAALPGSVPFEDAVFNLSRAVLVVQAFVDGDLALLSDVMADRLHQAYRLPHIDGAADALAAARGVGLPAALSGAGPGVVVFGLNKARVQAAVDEMAAAFERSGAATWRWVGAIDLEGAQVLS